MTTRTLRLWLLVGVAAFIGCSVYVARKATTDSPAAARPRSQVTVSSSVLDFGSTALHRTVVRQLLLRNDGKEPVVAVLSVEATSAGTSFTTDVAQVTLLPAVSSRVPIRLDATRPGEFVDQLKISLPDGLDPLLVELRGQAYAGPATRVARRSGVDGLEQSEGLTDSDPASVENAVDAAHDARDRRSSERERAASSISRNGDSAGRGESQRQRPAPDRVESRSTSAGAGATRIYEFDPSVSAPLIGIAEPAPVVSNRITAEDRASAHPVNEGVPDEGSGSDLDAPEEEEDSNSADDDPPKSDPEEPEAEGTPTFTLSSLSAVTLLGTSVRFNSQGVSVHGASGGGPFNLAELIQFPIVPLAFGESMLISQVGAGSGVFEAATGNFKLRLPLVIVDSDGDAAPVLVELTTGTSYGKNDSGIVVSISGSPRTPGSGWLKLVGLQKIPVGYRNGAEDNLVSFEILGQLSFNSGATSSL